MKNFFKKLNKGQDVEQDDLNLDYGDFYMGKESRSEERSAQRSAEPATERSAGGYYDVPKTSRGGYEEPDFRSDNTRYYDAERPAEGAAERPVERPVARDESFVKPRETWQEGDAPGFRPAQPEAEPVFTPAPAPEYLYFTPSTYRDCREGIVKGLSTGHVVVVRLRNLEAGDVLRLFDYMMGAVLALEGELVRPAATTVVLVPKDVELNEDELEPDDDEDYEDTDEAEDETEAEEAYEEESEYEDDEEYEDEAYEDQEDEEAEEEEYDEEEYEEDSYANGEYGSYEEDDEYEEDESEYEDDEEYDEEEYDEEEYDEEEYDEEEYDEEEYNEEEYEDDGYDEEEFDEDAE